jgi:WD40 repeat protein
MRFVLALLAVGCSHHSSDSPEVVQAPKGDTMKSYAQQVNSAALTPVGSVDNLLTELLAVAPEGATWASVFSANVRFFEGVRETRAITQQHTAAASIGFSPDGKTLRLGLHDVDVATGALAPQPPVPDLAAWATAAGLPAPPTLALPAARKSDDGNLIVVGATGVTRDRKAGLEKPRSGDVDWLIALDGATRTPLAVLWHGRGPITAIAISARHVAAGGNPVHVFARDALAKELRAGGGPPQVSALAWSPGGELLAAIGGGKRVAVWRVDRFDAPAASWDDGGDYQSGIAFHPTRPLLAVGNRDGHVRIFGVADAQLATPPLLVDRYIGKSVSAVAFAPDGTLYVAAEGRVAWFGASLH